MCFMCLNKCLIFNQQTRTSPVDEGWWRTARSRENGCQWQGPEHQLPKQNRQRHVPMWGKKPHWPEQHRICPDSTWWVCSPWCNPCRFHTSSWYNQVPMAIVERIARKFGSVIQLLLMLSSSCGECVGFFLLACLSSYSLSKIYSLMLWTFC